MPGPHSWYSPSLATGMLMRLPRNTLNSQHAVTKLFIRGGAARNAEFQADDRNHHFGHRHHEKRGHHPEDRTLCSPFREEAGGMPTVHKSVAISRKPTNILRGDGKRVPVRSTHFQNRLRVGTRIRIRNGFRRDSWFG